MLLKENNMLKTTAKHVTSTLRKKISKKLSKENIQRYQCDWCGVVFEQSVTKSSGQHPVSDQVVCPNGHFIKSWE